MNWLLAYHLAVSFFLLLVALNIALNWRVFVAPRPRRFDSAGSAPLVSALVPARNEARRITPCLQSLARQDYPNYEILVLDDHSEDRTADVVLDLGFTREKTGQRRLLEGRPLPEGWTGKSWACHQLAAAARGEYLLFTDADTVHDPAALGAFVGHASDNDAALLSAWPRQVTHTWSERAVIPLVYVLLLGALPHYLLCRLQRRPGYARGASKQTLETLGAANGQYILFRRDAYEIIGGHAAVRDHLVEDVALGRLVAARTGEGLRLINCDGSRLVSCRMYTSFAEVWEGFHQKPARGFRRIVGFVLVVRRVAGRRIAAALRVRLPAGSQWPLVVVAGGASGVDLRVAVGAGGAVPHVMAGRVVASGGSGVVAAHRLEQLAAEHAKRRDLEGPHLPYGRKTARRGGDG